MRVATSSSTRRLAGGAAAWPLVARAQQPATPVIGCLNSGSRDRYRPLLDAFREGLKDGGYVEDGNVKIAYRWAEGRFARLPELAADLVRKPGVPDRLDRRLSVGARGERRNLGNSGSFHWGP